MTLLEFARGPLFYGALLFFIAGMSYRLIRIVALRWTADHVPPKKSKFGGVVVSFLKGFLIWPFYPWVRGTFSKRPLTYIAGGILHLGLLLVVFFGTPHMLVWKSLEGYGWPTLPLPVIDWVSAITIIALVVLLVSRLTDPVMKKLTGTSEVLNLLVVLLPFISGYLLTHHLVGQYEMVQGIHILTVDILLIWIPLSRISHFMFYFFSRGIHGAEFAKRGAQP